MPFRLNFPDPFERAVRVTAGKKDQGKRKTLSYQPCRLYTVRRSGGPAARINAELASISRRLTICCIAVSFFRVDLTIVFFPSGLAMNPAVFRDTPLFNAVIYGGIVSLGHPRCIFYLLDQGEEGEAGVSEQRHSVCILLKMRGQ